MQYDYIHCYAHTLNLVLVDCATVVQSVREFFCLLEQLFVFVSTTKAHVTFMAKQSERILSCTKRLSDHLQSTEIDLAGAANLVIATKQTLEDYRSDSMWNKVYEYAKSVTELHGIEVAVPTSARKRRLSKHFEECVLLQSMGCRDCVI